MLRPKLRTNSSFTIKDLAIAYAEIQHSSTARTIISTNNTNITMLMVVNKNEHVEPHHFKNAFIVDFMNATITGKTLVYSYSRNDLYVGK